MLDCFGFHVRNGIHRLCDKSLITSHKGKIEMHDLVQQMGQEIVVEQSGQKRENQSRLWTYKDISSVLTNDGGTENVEAISLNMKMIDGYIEISSKAFLHMHKLRFLQVIDYAYSSKLCKVHLSAGLDFLPNSLRYLNWVDHPSSRLPSNFNLENLVELHMPHSRLEQLVWNKPLRNLKRICLNGSKNLTRILDLAKAPNLEVIDLRYCRSLVDIGSSIGNLNKLTTVHLQGCKRLYQLSEIPGNIEELYLNETGIRQLPLSSLHFNLCPNFASHSDTIWNLRSLKSLNISRCKYLNKLPEHLENLQSLIKLDASFSGLKELPSSICNLRSLMFLDISFCKRLNKLPEHLGNLEYLKELHAFESDIIELPHSICNLRSLRILNITDCKRLNKLPVHFGNLEYLEQLYASGSGIIELPSSICYLRSLKILDISFCKSLNKLPEHFGNLQSLKELYAQRSGLEELPSSISRLRSLANLDILYCKSVNKLPELLGTLNFLKSLDASGIGLKELPSSIQHLDRLEFLILRDCKKLKSLLYLPSNLRTLNAANCPSLKSVPATFKFPNVYSNLSNCQKLNEGISLIAQEVPWEIQNISADKRKWPRLCMVGSEVPQWMKYSNESGSSVSLELDAHGSSIHVIFCVVVAAKYSWHSFNAQCLDLYANLRDDCGNSSRDYKFDFPRYELSGATKIKFSFKHVFVWYDRVEQNVRGGCRATFSTSKADGYMQIIKCGVHPINN